MSHCRIEPRGTHTAINFIYDTQLIYISRMIINKYQRFNLYTGSPQDFSIENIFLFARQLRSIEAIILFIIFINSTHLIHSNVSSE